MNQQSQQADLLLSLVPANGNAIGNQSLREKFITGAAAAGFEADEALFESLRESLIGQGVLTKGKGRGGSVHRAEPDLSAFDLAAPELDSAAAAAGKPAAARKNPKPASPEEPQVIAYRHADRRVNNPEVGMVTPDSDPEAGKTRWAYDPHLDPALQFDSGRARIENLIDEALASKDADVQRAALEELKRLQSPYLNWSGKAERTSFEVDTVSLHVHERIDPASILRAVQKRMKDGKEKDGPSQGDFFRAWFEEPLPLSKAVEFYKHDRGWMNRLVAGDSLLVMNSLLRKEGMAGGVQMIYIDPPYGIKYGSNFQPFTNKRDVKDRTDADLTQEPEMIKAFRDTWELGIHSYLTYLRDRLLLAKELLNETGSVFVQISDENVHHVREISDEIFGVSNFVAIVAFRKTTGQSGDYLPDTNDYLVWYAKDAKKAKYRVLYQERAGFDWVNYDFVADIHGHHRKMSKSERMAPDAVVGGGGRIYRRSPLTSASSSEATLMPVEFVGKIFEPGKGGWKTNAAGFKRLEKANRLEHYGVTLSFRRYVGDFPFFPFSNSWTDTASGGYGADKVYVVQTNEKVIERCLLMTTDPGDLVLDPTCGSGTTAFVAEKWGRRWITCDTSRVAVTLAKQRLMTASFDYYELRYPHEGIKGGFFYKTVPHVTLKSIANNPEIDEIYARMHPEIEAALATLNDALMSSPSPSRGGLGRGWGGSAGAASQTHPHPGPPPEGEGMGWREWEVPFDFPVDWPESARAPFDAFHAARQAMQKQMDASIAAHADQETLYDQPQKAKNKLRITGPFTVEAVPCPTVKPLDSGQLSVGSGQSDQPLTTNHQPLLSDSSIARSGESARQHLWRDELLNRVLKNTLSPRRRPGSSATWSI